MQFKYTISAIAERMVHIPDEEIIRCTKITDLDKVIDKYRPDDFTLHATDDTYGDEDSIWQSDLVSEADAERLWEDNQSFHGFILSGCIPKEEVIDLEEYGEYPNAEKAWEAVLDDTFIEPVATAKESFINEWNSLYASNKESEI